MMTHHLVSRTDARYLACDNRMVLEFDEENDCWYTLSHFLHQGRRPRNRFCPGCLLTVDPLELLAELNI